MELGMVGLGRMGSNLVKRVTAAGHQCVVFDVNPDAVKASEADTDGVRGCSSLEELVSTMTPSRAVWVMVPAGEITTETVSALAEHLDEDDVIIDGGNSYYRDDIARAEEVESKGVHHVDVGTSGGVWGLERGYSLMIGGEDSVVERLQPIFEAIAPGVESAERTPGREGETSQAEHGYYHCGPHGAGHFVKMVHNGIEYGVMAAYAEGLNILKNANAGAAKRDTDAETAPMSNSQFYLYDLDLASVTEVWRRGSVIASWLLDLTAQAFVESPDLADFGGRVSDSGEGRWTSIAAIEEGVPAPVLASALYSRFSSRDGDQFANQVLSAMRKGFGGHDEKPHP